MSERLPDSGGMPVIGWREFVALPDWGVSAIKAKIDTGARTSALHVENIRRLPGDRVYFEAVLSHRKPGRRVPVTSDLVRISRVRPSTGHVQQRFVVATRVRLGRHVRRIELSLVCRANMLCRMLIGRTALEGFVIDPTRDYRFGKPERIRRDGARPRKAGSSSRKSTTKPEPRPPGRGSGQARKTR